MAIQRFSSRTHHLDQSFLAEQLKDALSYRRIAGYFTSSLFEIAHEWLEPIPARTCASSAMLTWHRRT